MRLLCFQAKAFRWQSHSKTVAEAVEQEIREAVVAFLHIEVPDSAHEREASVLRQSVKHLKWLANKRGYKKIVLHSFTHLGGDTAEPSVAGAFIKRLGERLHDNGYQVWTTPFGYLCEWDLSVYGESLAKVWKEIH